MSGGDEGEITQDTGNATQAISALAPLAPIQYLAGLCCTIDGDTDMADAVESPYTARACDGCSQGIDGKLLARTSCGIVAMRSEMLHSAEDDLPTAWHMAGAAAPDLSRLRRHPRGGGEGILYAD